MRVLCIGDVVSREGVDCLAAVLPRMRREYLPDVVIVNGENSAIGNGIDASSYAGIMAAGADIVTGGNHSFQKKNAACLHDEQKRLLRPANIPSFDGGTGELMLDLDLGRERLRVVSLAGSLFMPKCDNPFRYADRLFSKAPDCVTIVDFHAEATSEKRAMGFFLDGRVSLLFGTHTHVQTNDAQILPGGTGYVTDIGMTGVRDSILGKGIECCVNNFRYPEDRMKICDGEGRCALAGVFAQFDDASKKCVKIELVNVDN